MQAAWLRHGLDEHGCEDENSAERIYNRKTPMSKEYYGCCQ